MSPPNDALRARHIISNLLLSFTSVAREALGTDLCAIIHFGSTVNEPIKRETDIDLLLVLSKIPRSSRERFEIFRPLRASCEKHLTEAAKLGYSWEISILPQTKEKFLKFCPVHLDMIENSRILFEEDNLASRRFQSLSREMKDLKIEKVRHGLLWYWRLPYP